MPVTHANLNISPSDTLSMTIHFRQDNDDDPARPIPPPKAPSWWKTCTCYQIWPASFKDSNGDGLGDIKGILSKLDYLHDLGVDVIWLCPMYASPQADMGYDISDYNAVHPAYGTMEDMEELIAGLHNRGMRLLLDLVVNHTSDQHHWFKESKKGKDNKHSDWFIWKDPKIGKNGKKEPPNNWGAVFGGSAWKYVPERDQYYLHIFTPEQPDLNWENTTTRKAIYESALEFWFKKGIDGFRVDTSNIYSKVQSYPDGEVDSRSAPYGSCFPYIVNGPRIHEFWKEIRSQVLDNYGDPMMVGELGGSTFNEILKFVSSDERELSMVFDFDFAALGGLHTKPFHEITGYKLPELKTSLKKTQDLVANTKAWSSIFAENHDIPRSVSRHGTNDPKYHDRAAKVLAILLTTLSGTLFIYQGQEIGMTNIPESWSPSDLKDVSAINYWNKMKAKYPHDEDMLQRAWKGIVAAGRDNARTPLQWSGESNAGFTTGEPWMRVNENYTHINVAAQMEEKDTVWKFWRELLKHRKEHMDVFVQGSYLVYDYENEKTFTYQKKSASGKMSFVVLNFSSEECTFRLPDDRKDLEILISNVPNPGRSLQPWEGRIYIER